MESISTFFIMKFIISYGFLLKYLDLIHTHKKKNPNFLLSKQ